MAGSADRPLIVSLNVNPFVAGFRSCRTCHLVLRLRGLPHPPSVVRREQPHILKADSQELISPPRLAIRISDSPLGCQAGTLGLLAWMRAGPWLCVASPACTAELPRPVLRTQRREALAEPSAVAITRSPSASAAAEICEAGVDDLQVRADTGDPLHGLDHALHIGLRGGHLEP